VHDAAFVQTLQRDYVHLEQLDKVVAVLAALPHRIEDYNEIHPLEGLRMRSPCE
jgi:hypothetical protein